MSDLIDRYVAAVAANLPKKDRADVPPELRDILLSKVEAREAELGRPLTRKEEEGLLHDFGHPLEVAGRYGKSQYLIGPAVYPFYVFTLKVVIGIMIAIYLALYAMYAITGGMPGGRDQQVAAALWVTFGAVTATFWLIDRTGVIGKIARGWKPSQLPLMGAPKGRTAFTVLFEMAMFIIVALWWVGLIKAPTPAPHNLTLALAPIWHELFWPILALMIAQIALDLFELILPGMARAHAMARVVFHVVLIGLFVVILQAGHWVEVTVISGQPGLQQTEQTNFDRGFEIGIAVGIVIALYEIWCSARRAIRYERIRKAKMA